MLVLLASTFAAFADGGPIVGFVSFSACMIACGSVGAIAFAGSMVATGGAIAAATPAVGAGAVATCTDLCMLVSAYGFIAPTA